jgi:hypothetical protein
MNPYAHPASLGTHPQHADLQVRQPVPQAPRPAPEPAAAVPFNPDEWAKHRGADFIAMRNPTAKTVHMRFHDRPGVAFLVEIAPGQEARIPAEWYPAIHQVRDGVIVSGLAPQLELVDGETPPMHSVLRETSQPKASDRSRRR